MKILSRIVSDNITREKLYNYASSLPIKCIGVTEYTQKIVYYRLFGKVIYKRLIGVRKPTVTKLYKIAKLPGYLKPYPWPDFDIWDHYMRELRADKEVEKLNNTKQ